MRFFAIPGLCGTLVMLFLHPAAVRAAQINVALGNPVVQSTNGFGFDGSLAVDGIRTGNSISHTDSGDLAPFLEVDLGESFPIENINVATRDNCCTPGSPERDYNVLVEVRNASDTILYSSPVFNPWDGTGAGATDLGNGFVFELDLTGEPGGAVTGQKVRVRKTQAVSGSEWLHVAELEVLVNADFAPIVSLTVDRDSGALTWKNNTGSDLDLLGYSLTSSTGAFDQTGWTPVAGHYDAPAHGGDGSVDANDPWTVLTAADAHTDLSESELAGGNGGTIQNGQRVDLGSGVWIKNPTEDIAMQILRTDGTIDDVTVVFDGNGGQPFQRSDLNFDRTIDEADWTVYVAGLEVDLSGKSPAEAYQMGDLDNDGVNSVNDFALFKGDFNAANGPGAFAAMIASVPEPSSVALLGLGGLLLLVGASRTAGRCRGPNTDRLITIAVGGGALLGVLAIAVQGQAQDLNIALGQPVIQSTNGFGFNGSLAVDGIRTGDSISHTDSGDLTPFLEVDLGESLPIENINVATRDNCCTPDQPERDYNILVEVRDASDTILYSSPIFNPWDGTGAGATDLGNGFVFEFDLTGEPGGAVTGQKVRASKTQAFGGSEWLHVAELEVFTGLQNVPRLGLTVNRTTGDISLANRFDAGFTTDYYRISSAADSLDPSRWRSLDQQDVGARPRHWRQLGRSRRGRHRSARRSVPQRQLNLCRECLDYAGCCLRAERRFPGSPVRVPGPVQRRRVAGLRRICDRWCDSRRCEPRHTGQRP